MRPRRAFTLLEILLVVAIVALLAALLFPVLTSAKRSSYRAHCIENLRQLGAALAMYESEFEKQPPSIDAMSFATLLNSKDLALCPADPVKGYGSKFDACRGTTHTFSQSYETIFGWASFRLERLAATDPNYGVIACRLHGHKAEKYTLGLEKFCDYAWHMFEGALLRLRKDGSVQTARLRLHRITVGRTVAEESMSIWELFTDFPDPALKGRP